MSLRGKAKSSINEAFSLALFLLLSLICLGAVAISGVVGLVMLVFPAPYIAWKIFTERGYAGKVKRRINENLGQL